MQRVAIARALVTNPEIILADEPTGALDTNTSLQVMEILKKISKDKLIIMVTHNPELAEKYSSRIIKILDGNITEDSNPIIENEKQNKKETKKIGRTSMKFWTAFRLSLNNLLTKKGRTILISIAGSIGIIGIALVQAVSNGFQAYVDSIQEDTLTSYPLTIMQESADITSALLSMTTQNSENDDSGTVKEEQYISTMLSNLSANDLKSFKNYLENNNEKIEQDVSSIQYSYSVEPTIYTTDSTGKIAKVNPSNLFKSNFSSSMMTSMTSSYSQMVNDKDSIKNSYDVLMGHLPEKYDEMMIVLSEPNSISDLLVYSLGLRDTEELSNIVTKIMNGETVKVKNEPLTFSYEDLMNVELKLIMPTDVYKYNKKYNLYEDMSENEESLKKLYNNAINLKIVGIVSPKEGVTSMMLNPGVSYTSDLIDYIIDYSSKTDIVKKQLKNEEIDVFSGSKFDSKNNNLNLEFGDLVSIDNKKLESAFNIKIDQKKLEKETKSYMEEISNSITTDISPARKTFINNLNILANGMFNSIKGEIKVNNINNIISNYLNTKEAKQILSSMETNYIIPMKEIYSKYLISILKAYVVIYPSYTSTVSSFKQEIDNSNLAVSNNQNIIENNTNNADNNTETPNDTEKNVEDLKIIVDKNIVNIVVSSVINSKETEKAADEMAKVMTEAVMKKTILTKVGELTNNLTSSFASAFNVDKDAIANSFQLKMTEEEMTRIVTAMMTDTQKTAKTNLISLGYQNKEEPTYISFYFNSFDGKERFIDFIDSYNDKMEQEREDDKVINYTDTTGILMDSVKTIVNAVTYVLIAFISISLVVSSIMIGIITYISVYERTKEIGILRSIGASKRNISSIFNAETFIIGLLSGLYGIGISYAIIPAINGILHHFTGNIPLEVTLYFKNALLLIILSIILTLIGGLIPAKAASKKDPAVVLRSE